MSACDAGYHASRRLFSPPAISARKKEKEMAMITIKR
jgi:hypothetical protein